MSIAKALRALTDYADGVNQAGVTEAIGYLQALEKPKAVKPSEDGYLNSVLATAARKLKKKPRLFVNVSGGEVLIQLKFPDRTMDGSYGLEGGVLTTETLRRAAESGIRHLVEQYQREGGNER